MRKCFSAERFLLFRLQDISSHLPFSQRWNASTKAAPLTNDALVELLDRVNQANRIGTDSRSKKPRDAAKPYLDESAQEQHSSLPDLPLSPLMDPKLISARQRYRTPKPEPTGTASALEMKLKKSPYAQALTTPIRHCQLTNARLPSYFLLSFGVTKHPTTGAQWHLPRIAVDPLLMSKEDGALAETCSEYENADENSKIESMIDVSPQSGKRHEIFPVLTTSDGIMNVNQVPLKKLLGKLALDSSIIKDTVPQSFEAEVHSSVPETRHGSSSYFICSQPALKLISNFTPKSRMDVVSVAWRNDYWIQANKLVWRKDMDEFVLELQRKKTLALLRLLASSQGGYVTLCEGYKSVGAHHQVGAVLWLGARTHANTPRGRKRATDSPTLIDLQNLEGDPMSLGTAMAQQETTSADRNPPLPVEVAASGESEPPFYAMFKYKSHFIPIYNLPVLLGSEHLAHLRATNSCLQGTMAVVKKKVRAVPAQMELWRLMGYMAHLGKREGRESGNHEGRRVTHGRARKQGLRGMETREEKVLATSKTGTMKREN